MPAITRRGFSLSRINSLFRDHEILIRTEGQVRFLRLSARAQRRAALLSAGLVAAWAGGTAAMVASQVWTGMEMRAVSARASAVATAEARVAAERRSVDAMAQGLDARQDRLEALLEAHFGDVTKDPPVAATDAAVGSADISADPSATPAARIAASAARQEALVGRLTHAVEQRTARAEAALKTVGLNPRAAVGQGGPFVPGPDLRKDPALGRLADRLARMDQVESLLVALPSGAPADGMELSSGFGWRLDPFNGERALHAGLDFRGPHGSAIRAAAPGRVSFVGVRSGYGNVIEIDHGHGLMTRYAHLAGFDVRPGDSVASGARIGRMGSTGRSTGTHLHFEVRVGGEAVNPRRFLEANRDVLEVKADARSRVLGRVASS